MQLLYERILVEPLSETGKSEGIQTKQQQLPRGLVKEVGEGRLQTTGECLPLKVQVGDIILYDRMKARPHFGMELIIENDVYGIEQKA